MAPVLEVTAVRQGTLVFRGVFDAFRNRLGPRIDLTLSRAAQLTGAILYGTLGVK